MYLYFLEVWVFERYLVEEHTLPEMIDPQVFLVGGGIVTHSHHVVLVRRHHCTVDSVLVERRSVFIGQTLYQLEGTSSR